MADLVTRLLLDNNSFDSNLEQTTSKINRFGKGVNAQNAMLKQMTGALAGVAGLIGVSLSVSSAISQASQSAMRFEKSLSVLRSMTGATREELTFYKAEAIKLGATTTQTATEIADAFKIVGSQKPELLKNKEALKEVTKQAVVLAEAAQIDVPEAAKALTGSLNQMGKSAGYAGDYINILAAASQQGSADIPYLNSAIEKAGGTASSTGVQFNQLVAAIEAIAPKITEASTAGTNLRNIFLKLDASSEKNFRPSVVGLTKALENLKAAQMSTAELTKMFGSENVTAALALTKAIDKYKEYETSLVGTNTALEQQLINNDNLEGSIAGLGSAWEGFTLKLAGSQGALKSTVDWLTSAVRFADKAINGVDVSDLYATKVKADKYKKDIEEYVDYWKKVGVSTEEANKKAKAYFADVAQGKINAAEAIYDKDKSTLNKTRLDIEKEAWGMAMSSIEDMEVKADTVVVEGVKSEGEKDKDKKKDPIPFSNSELKAAGQNYNRPSVAYDPLNMYNSKRNEELEEEQQNVNTLSALYEKLFAAERGFSFADETGRKYFTDIIKDTKKAISGIEGVTNANDKNINSFRAIQGILSVSSNLTNQGAGAWLTWGANVMTAVSSNMNGLKDLVNLLMVKSVAESAAAGPLGWLNAVAAGIAVAGAVASLPKFANGGIVYGRTVAEVGEYAGANSNPEVIAPLSKLKEIISPGSGGRLEVVVSGELKGRGGDLVATINNYSSRKSRG